MSLQHSFSEISADASGGSTILSSKFNHEAASDESSWHRIALQLLMGFSLFCAVASFAALLFH